MEQIQLEHKEIVLLHHCMRAWNANTYDNLQDINDLLVKDPENSWLNEFHDWLVKEYDVGVDLEEYLYRFVNN